jgi:hypothetical protein
MPDNRQIRFKTVVSQDGAAVLDRHSGEIKTLNATGAYIWQALQRGDCAETITKNLARDTGEDISTVEQGVAAFLAELKRRRFWPCSE